MTLKVLPGDNKIGCIIFLLEILDNNKQQEVVMICTFNAQAGNSQIELKRLGDKRISMKAKRLIVIRHAESIEDVDNSAYELLTDEEMPLTEAGVVQSVNLANRLSSVVGENGSIHFYVAPCLRVIETARIVSDSMKNSNCTSSVEELLKKQNRGLVTMDNRKQIERERYESGVLRYAYSGGESGPEFIARHRHFLDNIKETLSHRSCPENVAIISHGFGMRVLLMILLGWDEDYFETLAYPNNCEFKQLDIQPDGSFVLVDSMRLHNLANSPGFIQKRRF